MTDITAYFTQYSPIGDILVIATCMVFIILFQTSYMNRTESFITLRNILALLIIAAASNVIFYTMLLNIESCNITLLYIMRLLTHVGLTGNLYLYVIYLREPLHLVERERIKFERLAAAAYILIVIYDILSMFLPIGFHITEDKRIISGFNMFILVYVFIISLIAFVLHRFRRRIYYKVVLAIAASTGVSFLVMFIQGLNQQVSFTVATFLFPFFAIMYIAHSNPYDLELGSVGYSGFEDSIDNAVKNKSELEIISLNLIGIEKEGSQYPRKIRRIVRKLSDEYFRFKALFDLGEGRFVLTVDSKKCNDLETKLKKLISEVSEDIKKADCDYKMVYGPISVGISDNNDCINLIKYIENRMPVNSGKLFTGDEIKAYREHRYIVNELENIHKNKDMDDDRVLVFCQPVLNTRTNKFDTAEALMRLRLPDMGMVFPDRFIPIAEKYGYITSLSLILLSKCCNQIKEFISEGYYIERLSVNFSMIDLRQTDFTQNVKNIILNSQLKDNKIAIELTESQNEKDFMIVKEKINELKEFGMKFYLDDFGTGYSNFERLMELPIDIIKFDRSLVIASASNKQSETMVSYLAHMFSDLNYAVLYEGVETEEDESRCTDMCARYLQGYKYSKPIPIEQLRNFLEKKVSC
ncbi:MAG: EAL domain-containing protein [Lachnospiraceae bacterium]|nr:EAL domain-containing protein [Lachnospiraceae bacterium]